MIRIRRILVFIALSVSAMFSLSGVALAAGGNCGAGAGSSFFKLIPTWHQYLDKDANCDIDRFNIPGDLWKVGLAAVDIILRIAGVVAFVAIVKAGFAFVLSRGNPSEVAKARQSIIDALIGVAIASVATLLVAFLGNTLT